MLIHHLNCLACCRSGECMHDGADIGPAASLNVLLLLPAGSGSRTHAAVNHSTFGPCERSLTVRSSEWLVHLTGCDKRIITVTVAKQASRSIILSADGLHKSEGILRTICRYVFLIDNMKWLSKRQTIQKRSCHCLNENGASPLVPAAFCVDKQRKFSHPSLHILPS